MMKTKIIILITTCLLATSALAQEVKKAEELKSWPSKKADSKVKKNTAPTVTGEVKITEVRIERKAPVGPTVKTLRAVKKETVVPASQPAKTTTAASKATTGVPAVATKPGQPPVDPDDVVGIVKQLIQSAKTGKWALLVGLIVMLLTWVVNRTLKQKIPSAMLPWLAIGLSTIAAVSFALATGVGWGDAIIVGVQNGLAAAGSWSAIGKYLPGLVSKAEPPAGPATGTTGSPT